MKKNKKILVRTKVISFVDLSVNTLYNITSIELNNCGVYCASSQLC